MKLLVRAHSSAEASGGLHGTLNSSLSWPVVIILLATNDRNDSSFSIRLFLFFPAQNEKMLSIEGVWSLGGEATQDPVRQRELDLGVLQESETK